MYRGTSSSTLQVHHFFEQCEYMAERGYILVEVIRPYIKRLRVRPSQLSSFFPFSLNRFAWQLRANLYNRYPIQAHLRSDSLEDVRLHTDYTPRNGGNKEFTLPFESAMPCSHTADGSAMCWAFSEWHLVPSDSINTPWLCAYLPWI